MSSSTAETGALTPQPYHRSWELLGRVRSRPSRFQLPEDVLHDLSWPPWGGPMSLDVVSTHIGFQGHNRTLSPSIPLGLILGLSPQLSSL
jgi:hypothetical protein